MNGAVTVFKNQEFGQIRSLMIEDEPWFVGKDVCEIFGDTNYRRSLMNVDDCDKCTSQIKTAGGRQNMTIINESGLYTLLFQMQPQKAKGVSQNVHPSNKQIEKLPKGMSQNDLLADARIEKLKKFKHWVTAEVLPAIRKTGSYSVNQNQKPQPQPQSNLEQTLANALLAAQHIISYRDQQLAELQGLIPAGSQPVQIKEPEQLVQIQELEPPKEPDPPKEPEPPEPAAEPKRTYRQRSILATCTQICVKEQILDIAAMNVARQLHCSQNEAIGLIVRYWMWNVKVMDSNGNVPYTSREEVADVLIRGKCDAYTAEEAVDALISTKLISKENGMLQAADWMRWQGMITNAEKLRVQNNRRQREYRRRQKNKSTMEA